MDGKTPTRDRRIAELAARQHGAVSTAQLRNLGLSEDAIRGRVLAGRLHRVHRAVYAVGHVALAPEGRLLAAVLAVARQPGNDGGGSVLEYWGAAISHRSAGSLWGLLPFLDGAIDVTLAGDTGRAKRRGIRVHRSSALRAADVTLRNRIPVTTPPRTIADLRRAAATGSPGAIPDRELRRAIREANVIGLPVGDGDRLDRTRSDLEAEFLRLCRRHRLPMPEVNVRIGSHLVDFVWRKQRLVVETDSYIYHRGRAAFREDRDRDLDLRRLGYDVIRLDERQVAEEPDRVAETLAAILLPDGGDQR